MCIRDRNKLKKKEICNLHFKRRVHVTDDLVFVREGWGNNCLLYTSDAADERSSVDLGGRRIIKKNNSVHEHEISHINVIHKKKDIQR